MEENEIRKVKARFWLYLILSYLGLTELKDSILEIYEAYVDSGSGYVLISGLVIILFWIAFSKSNIKATIREFKMLRDFKSAEYIQDEDESDKSL